jgi:hypothetical protein
MSDDASEIGHYIGTQVNKFLKMLKTLCNIMPIYEKLQTVQLKQHKINFINTIPHIYL